MEQEDNAAGFMGITLGRDEATGLVKMKQIVIIERVIKTLGLDYVMEKSKFSPSESKPLVNYADESATCGTFIYISVVGMLLYLSGCTVQKLPMQ